MVLEAPTQTRGPRQSPALPIASAALTPDSEKITFFLT